MCACVCAWLKARGEHGRDDAYRGRFRCAVLGARADWANRVGTARCAPSVLQPGGDDDGLIDISGLTAVYSGMGLVELLE